MPNILITGASSGIGEYLAYAYARRGYTLGLVARREDRLNEVARHCDEIGGKASIFPADVTDRIRMEEIIGDFSARFGPIDIVIANAGVGLRERLSKGDSGRINRVLAVNVLGVANTVVPVIPAMVEQRAGTIVIISSVAGFLGLPRHGTYSGSKAAVRVMADGWRYELSRYNIQISTICPGFIETPMVAKLSGLPFLVNVELAVEKIIRSIDRGRKTYVFPWPWRFLLPVIKFLPSWAVKQIYGSR